MPASAPLSIPPSDISLALEKLASEIATRHPAAPDRRLILIGIANGGVHVVTRLQLLLRKHYPENARPRTGILDISFHRDDIGLNPIPRSSPRRLFPWM